MSTQHGVLKKKSKSQHNFMSDKSEHLLIYNSSLKLGIVITKNIQVSSTIR